MGGQCIAGIPYLYELLTHEELSQYSHVWPFTTGFNDPTVDADGPLVVHAEVFPNVIKPEIDWGVREIPDACQVWSLVNRTPPLFDAAGGLAASFALPPLLAVNPDPDAAIAAQTEEGWILFS